LDHNDAVSVTDSTVLETIRELLTRHGVTFKQVHHRPTHTSEESAQARGEPLAIGGKALLMKVGTGHARFVISAARKVDSAAIRRQLGVRRLRFVSAEELHQLTGLVSGDVPPFGEPVLPFPLYADESVFENDRIAFNAGSLTDSIIMSVPDWEAVARPRRIRFSRPEGGQV
jgi:prolyl-tRNA editing enzyme YbaK/EbsC (Cys-tRNA(Pro) deacylase)